MATKTMVTRRTIITEPEILTEGDEVVFQVPIPHVVSGITGTPTLKFSKKNTGSDLSAIYFTGSMSIVGTYTIQTKQTQNLKAGEYVMTIRATIDGQTYTCCITPITVMRENQL